MIAYRGHIQNIGWANEAIDGETSGTIGQGLRLEALEIRSDYPVRYKAHVQNVGWQEWVKNGEMAGTTGQGLRMEAFCIELVNPPEEKHTWYRVHVENVGWTDWTIDGKIAGSVGEGLRLEAIEIQIVDAATNEEFSKWYENSKKCKLGDVIFTVTSDETTTMSNDITDKPIEGGTVSDHVLNKPLTMSITGIIIGDDCQQKLETIRGYLVNGDLVRYVGVDTARNMVIESFGTGRSVDIKGGASFSLSMKEIRISTGLVTVIDEAYIYTQANSVTNGGLLTDAQKTTVLLGGNNVSTQSTNLTYFDLSTPSSSGIIEVDKKRLPYSIDVKCKTSGSPYEANKRINNTFSIEFHYNAEQDFFTTRMVNKDTGNLIYEGKLMHRIPLGGIYYGKADGIGVDLIWVIPPKEKLTPPFYRVGWNEIDSLQFEWRDGGVE